MILFYIFVSWLRRVWLMLYFCPSAFWPWQESAWSHNSLKNKTKKKRNRKKAACWRIALCTFIVTWKQKKDSQSWKTCSHLTSNIFSYWTMLPDLKRLDIKNPEKRAVQFLPPLGRRSLWFCYQHTHYQRPYISRFTALHWPLCGENVRRSRPEQTSRWRTLFVLLCGKRWRPYFLNRTLVCLTFLKEIYEEEESGT